MAAVTPTAIVTTKGTMVSDAGTVTRQPGHPMSFISTSDPTADNDSSLGYRVTDMWVNTATPKVLVATSVAVGAAVWTVVS